MATPLELALYVGLPYVSVVLFFLIPLYRKRTNDIAWDWTTRASGLFDNRGIGLASLFLHWGLLFVFAGQLLGITGSLLGGGPYVNVFFWIGAIGGVSALFGSLLALVRRVLSPRMRAMSTPQDYVIHVLLIAVLAPALYNSVVVGAFGLSYTVFPWFVGLFTLSPTVEGIAGAPLSIRAHVVASFLFWAYFPFTKLVHLWSAPLGYLVRPYISVRRYESIYPERRSSRGTDRR